ncbi:MAG: hypothetical protein LBQ76_03725, partial [Candidatus Fibromonas sp.]|nr:hypothetical protein [Candidatus Fibromonas sp.]
ETRAMNREEGKMLAEYLSQNYFEDPEEAKAFMDTISKWAYKSEMRDKGYMFMNSVHSDMIWKERPDYVKMWANENGYGNLWDDNGHMKYDIDSKEYQSFRRAYDAAQMEYFYKNPPPYKEVMTVREYLSEVDPECLTSGESVNLLAGPGDLPGIYQEHWQSWLEQFRSNEKAVQSVIDNAKLAIKGVSIEDLLAKHGGYI